MSCNRHLRHVWVKLGCCLFTCEATRTSEDDLASLIYCCGAMCGLWFDLGMGFVSDWDECEEGLFVG